MGEVSTTESWLTLPDSHQLYTKTWSAPPTTELRARIIFVHGFSDHCNQSDNFFHSLASKGINVHSFDQRGWGRSVHQSSEKGLTGPTSQVLDDITQFAKSVLSQYSNSGVPVFLMGHSMGGAEVLTYAAEGPKEVVGKLRGVLVEAPFCALHPHTRPWKLTVVLGRFAGKLLPHMKMVNKLDPTRLSRDQEVGEQFKADELCHETGTLEGLAGMLDRAAMLEEGKVVVREGLCEGGKTRLWVSHGTADGICDFDATKRVFERAEVEDKTMQVYEGWYHVLHAEPGEDKAKFAEDVAKWILDRSAPLGAEGTRSKL